jgi:hypothetical protein
VAQFNDVLGATDAIEQAATALVNAGGKLNSPSVAAALADPDTTAGQWAQGAFANSGLSPVERNYVIQVKGFRENLQSLRKSAGGGISDAQVEKLMQMAPGASTPDLDYLKRQTGQIKALRARLAKGVSTAKGGLAVQGGAQPPATQGGASVTAPDGTVHQFPNQAAAAQFKAAAGIQ